MAAYPDDPSGLAEDAAAVGFAQLQGFSEALEAKRLAWLADQDRRGSFRRDGYLTAPAWLAHQFGVAAGTAKAQVKVAQALDQMPSVKSAFHSGDVGSSAVNVLVDAREEHPEAFASQEQALLEAAQTRSVEELRAIVREWSLAVDADAAEQAERLRNRRRLDAWSLSTGMVKVAGELDPENGEALLTASAGSSTRSSARRAAMICGRRHSGEPTRSASCADITWTTLAVRPWLESVRTSP